MNAGMMPGRSCPLDYHYGPEVFRQPAPAHLLGLDVLYVVGGLYGNELALEAVLRLFDEEEGRKCLMFNGDFHWFDAEPALFDRIQREVLAHEALRGNVETELSRQKPEKDAGCGCGYPDWVDGAVVKRSNRILERLRSVTTPDHRRQLSKLPMWQIATVGDLRIGIVHGDAQSLAGWGFAQEHLAHPEHREMARQWFAQAGVEAFASTHSCLPVFQRILARNDEGAGWIFNNGAAGMPNFRNDAAGLLTRIAVSPRRDRARRYGIEHRGINIEAISIETAAEAALQRFLTLWPPGSDAHISYFNRMTSGPDYRPDQAVRQEY